MEISDRYEPLNIHKLLNAFKTLGGNEQGLLDYRYFKSLLILKGDMTEKEVEDILEDEDSCVKGKKIDYMDLCISILSTKAIYNHMMLEDCRNLNHSNRINSRTFTRRKGQNHSNSSENNKPDTVDHGLQNVYVQCSRGNIYNASCAGELTGHRYSLEIYETATVEIIAKAIDILGTFNMNPSIEILVFHEHEKNKTLVAYSTFRNSEGFCAIRTSLKQGKYLVVPVVLNWEETKSKHEEIPEMPPLTTVGSDGRIVPTLAFKNALKSVYDFIDLDGNSLLSQKEFDLFIQHIAGETAEDEWSTVEDNFEMKNGQLTFDGFLSLYQMALEADPQDVISMFRKMGFNKLLNSEMTIPFLITVNSEAGNLILQPLPTTPFFSLMEKVLCKIAIDHGDCSKVRNMNDLSLHVHKLPHRVIVAVQNKSHSNIKLQLDCRKSENCSSHRKTLNYILEVLPRTSSIGHYLFPVNIGNSWSVDCIETPIK